MIPSKEWLFSLSLFAMPFYHSVVSSLTTYLVGFFGLFFTTSVSIKSIQLILTYKFSKVSPFWTTPYFLITFLVVTRFPDTCIHMNKCFFNVLLICSQISINPVYYNSSNLFNNLCWLILQVRKPCLRYKILNLAHNPLDCRTNRLISRSIFNGYHTVNIENTQFTYFSLSCVSNRSTSIKQH